MCKEAGLIKELGNFELKKAKMCMFQPIHVGIR